jgi:hypothetical protein
MLLLHTLLIGGGAGPEKGLAEAPPAQGLTICIVCHDLITHGSSTYVGSGRGQEVQKMGSPEREGFD